MILFLISDNSIGFLLKFNGIKKDDGFDEQLGLDFEAMGYGDIEVVTE